MAVAEAAAEYSKGLWNHGGSSDEIFFHGRQYLVGIASPASDYLRGLPRWLAEEAPALRRICVLYSSRGTFGHQVARGIMESVRALGRQSVQLIRYILSWRIPPRSFLCSLPSVQRSSCW